MNHGAHLNPNLNCEDMIRPTLLPLTLLLIPAVGFALPTDKDQPVEIISEMAEFRDQEEYAVYTGSVRMTQGSLEIDAEKVELYFMNGELDRATIYGSASKQAYFQQQPDIGEKLVRGLANRIIYKASDDKIRLIGTKQEEAYFCQKGNEQKGMRMTYDIEKDIMKAKARTRSVFRPETAPGSCDHIRSPYR